MATVYWLGTADAVAQVEKATPASVEVNDIFNLIVGGDTVATFTATAATVANVTAGLTTAWNASTHPYATGITATDDTTHVTLTADTEGCPFVVTSSTVNGGAVDDQTLVVAAVTANAGPHCWDTAANFSGGSVPGGADIVWVTDSNVNICWGISSAGVAYAELHITQSYIGRIGLNRRAFATSADGVTVDKTKMEYRDCYLDTQALETHIGKHDGPGSPVGSSRILIHQKNTSTTNTYVWNTGRKASESGLPVYRWLADDEDSSLFVIDAPGGIGIAIDAPGETSVVWKVCIGKAAPTTTVEIGAGVTYKAAYGIYQDGGTVNLTIGDGETIPVVLVNAGVMHIDGLGGSTAITNVAGAVYVRNVGINAAINCQGGMTDLTTGGRRPLGITAINLSRGATLKGDYVICNTDPTPPNGPYTLTVS